MSNLRILVTGSRDWTDSTGLYFAMDAQLWANPKVQGVTVVNGMCEDGADWLAFKWAQDYDWVTTEEHPAKWKRYGKRAGFLRNKEMVESGADICVAFLMPCVKPTCHIVPAHDSHGASMTADLAEFANIPVVRWRRAENGDLVAE